MWNQGRIILLALFIFLGSCHGYSSKAKNIKQMLPLRTRLDPASAISYHMSEINEKNKMAQQTKRDKEGKDKHAKSVLPASGSRDARGRGSPTLKLKGSIFSTWSRIANKHAAKWYLSLKDVSFRDGTLHIHLPPTSDTDFDYDASSRSVSGLVLPHKTVIDHTPLDLATCSSMETRHIVHSFPCHPNNCFMSNFGHLLINVLNPLFTYLFFVHENITTLKGASVPANLLPLPNTLLLFKSKIEDPVYLANKNPTFLFDVALRFASEFADLDKYFRDKVLSGGVHCFRSFSMPIFSMQKRLFQEWDSMHWSLKGRWGRDDFYFNFWREMKRQIFHLYNITPAVMPAPHSSNETQLQQQAAKRRLETHFLPPPPWGTPIPDSLSHSPSTQTPPMSDDVSLPRPKLLWLERGLKKESMKGSRTHRADVNIARMNRAVSKYLDFHVVGDSYYQWYRTSEQRYNLTRSTLLHLQSADVVAGITGSNMQAGLFTRENSMLIDVKTAFCYCSNEVGKTIASHNRMAFFQSHAQYIGTPKFNGMWYDEDKIALFAKEVSMKFYAEQVAARKEQEGGSEEEGGRRRDEWRGECRLSWPDEDPWMKPWKGRGKGGGEGKGTGSALLTRSAHSRCYLDNLGGNETSGGAGGGPAWYQLAVRNNRVQCITNTSISLDFGEFCFRKELC